MFSDPTENLKRFDIKEDMVIADLGAGSGFYSVAASYMVPRGKVYAVEIIPDFVTTIRNQARDLGIVNIQCILGDAEKVGGTKIKTGIVDRVIASNMLFQVDDKDAFIEEVKRILKPGGKLLLIDWSSGDAVGPRKDHLVPKERAQEMFEKKGFAWERDISPGDYHYGIIFSR